MNSFWKKQLKFDNTHRQQMSKTIDIKKLAGNYEKCLKKSMKTMQKNGETCRELNKKGF